MTLPLAKQSQGVLARVESSPTTLLLPADLTYEELEDLGALIGMMGDTANWWLGEWLIQGEMLHGDKIYQAAELTRRSPQTLANVASVVRRVPANRRRQNVSFSSHAEIAALPPNDQKHWLRVASEESLTKAELRARVQAVRDGHPDVLPPEEPAVCESCGRPL